MKLPEKIKGKNRIRNGAIKLYFKRDHMDYSQIAEKFKLTERRILQILSTNHAFIKRDKEWEKEKRINILNRLITKRKEETNRDIVDLLEAQRKEIDGDSQDKGTSRETKVVIIRESNANQDQSGQLSRQISVLRV